jgi:hypothetical protein
MKTIITFLLLLFVGGLQSLPAQEKLNGADKKKKIELRPNSRDYGPVVRDNLHNRIDRKKDKAFVNKRKTEIRQNKAIQMQRKQTIRQQKIIRRQSIIQQRRATRR